MPIPDAFAPLERTLAIIKPEAVASGDAEPIIATARAAGFRIVRMRRWHLDVTSAADLLTVSWGNRAGNSNRRFFREMTDYYSGGEIIALLLERRNAVAAWREILGPGDPSVARVSAPKSIRARWGTNKQANAAHGADSTAAAAREIAHVFGAEHVQPSGDAER